MGCLSFYHSWLLVALGTGTSLRWLLACWIRGEFGFGLVRESSRAVEDRYIVRVGMLSSEVSYLLLCWQKIVGFVLSIIFVEHEVLQAILEDAPTEEMVYQ